MNGFRWGKQKSKYSSSLNQQAKKRKRPQKFALQRIMVLLLGKGKDKKEPKKSDKSDKPSWRSPMILEPIITPSPVPWNSILELLLLDLGDLGAPVDIASAESANLDVTSLGHEDLVQQPEPELANDDLPYCTPPKDPFNDPENPIVPEDPFKLPDPPDPADPPPKPPKPPDVGTDIPAPIVIVDPPSDTPQVTPPQGSDNGNGSNSDSEPEDEPPEPNEPPVISNPVDDLVLTPTNPTEGIDLTSIFSDPENSALTYEVIAGDSEYLTVNLTDDSQLELTALPKTGTTTVAIQATDVAGNSVIHSFDVTTSNLHQELVDELDNALSDLTAVLQENPSDLMTGLLSPAGVEVLDRIEEIVGQTPDILKLLTEPEVLGELGFDDDGVAAVQELLNSPEVGEFLGLPVSVSEALNNPNSGTWDQFLINAPADAIALLSEDADLPAVGFLDDFTNGHGEKVTKTFESINPKGSYDNIQVSDGNWAEQLKLFVDNLKDKGHDRGIANLSFDLSQVDDKGQVTTRYELTPEEWQAIQYARDNNVLLVVAAGNTGDRMSALGAAAQEFDNIITVGAVNSWEEAADYSSRGEGLTLVAPGGTFKDDPDEFVGTSKAASYVTGAASIVWGVNPELNVRQIKDTLGKTAKDLGPEGRDRDTGAGLIDVLEATMMAAWLASEALVIDQRDDEKTSFSGAGRVTPSQRAASAATEAEISRIQNHQDRLLEQLTQLSDGSLTAAELEEAVKQQRLEALDTYRQRNTDAEIAKTQYQQLTDAQALATNHYTIEQGRLEALLARQQELKELLAQLQQDKVGLQEANAQQLDALQDAIAQTDRDLADARDKLQYQLVEPDTLLADPTAVREIAADHKQLAAHNVIQSDSLAAQASHHQNLANHHAASGWRHQIVGYNRGRCGRSRPLWGWLQNFKHVKLRDQNQWQANIASQNSAILAQLASQQAQQGARLDEHAELLENNNQTLAQLQGDPNDSAQVLQALQAQATEQTELANHYWQQAELAEQRRKQNQDTANWHNSRYRRWQVVGYSRHGCHQRPVYGWRYYSEHIPPRNQAQQQANLAEQERQGLEQLARQAQQQADALNQQARDLQERISDWPVIKQGIEYEIAADAQKLQAEEDLQGLQQPIQQQQLAQLDLQISQTETELQKLENEQLPSQQSKVTATETRLNEINAQVESLKAGKQGQNLQNFLETYGFLLPYQERRDAFQKQVQDLASEEIRVQELLLQLGQQLAVTPDAQLQSQYAQLDGYLQDITESKNWAQVQLEQLNLSAPDSPQRLEIESLLDELSQRVEAEVGTNTLPLSQYIDFLRELSSRNRDLLTGLDDLETRLERAKQEQEAAERAQPRLEEEYRDLGLEKASLEEDITVRQAQIDVKDGEIATTSEEIAQTEATLTAQKDALATVEAALAQKLGEVDAQQQVIDDTETQIGDTQARISAKDAEISQQQSELQGYQTEIASAYTVAQQYEQQRQQNQDSANYWNDRIQTWGVTHYRSESYRYKSGKHWKTGWRQVPVYGWIYNPEAEANRDNYLAAANTSAQWRDDATAEAQQLEASLQPTIASTTESIEQLELEKQALLELEAGLQEQLSHQQGELQQFEGERQGIVDEANAIQSQIDATQQQLNSLNSQLNAQRQQRTDLAASLADLERQLLDNEAHLADKYREMELTDRYLQQVQSEVSRLESRLELLNKADVLEQDYQAASQDWYEAIATQIAATETLLATRQAGEGDRTQLLSLQSQLSDVETDIATKQQEQQQLQQEVADAQQALDLTELQLGNQQLQLQSLQAQDGPLQSAEQYYYNLAQQQRQKIWYWNGRTYAYNAGAANKYRQYLQKASLLADERNQVWQQRQETETRIAELTSQQATQQSQLSQQQTQLTETTRAVEELTTQAAAVQEAIAPLQDILAPLQGEEQVQRQAFSEAIARSENKSAELAETTQEQVAALERAIGFGVLASESDIDFFSTQIEPKVSDFIAQLSQRSQDFNAQAQQLTQLIDDWQAELTGTSDPVSSEALQDLITQTQATRDALLTWEGENADAAEQLSQRLDEAKAALKPLQQQQELELRNSLDGNEERLTALERLLETENAVARAIASDTVLASAQLQDRVNQDIRESLANWTKQLLDGNQQTKELGETQQALSAGVDELIAYIQENLTDPLGQYNLTRDDLRDYIATLAVVAARQDELLQGETTLQQEIEKIKHWIEQDAKLHQEIAPIAERYEAESQTVEEYQQQQYAVKKKNLEEAKAERARKLARIADRNPIINPDTGKAYYRTGKTSWYGAQAEAESVGGNLVTIKDREEENWLKKIYGGSHFWIGLTDRKREGRWEWVSGEAITYTNWYPGEPNNWHNEDYALMNWGGRWNDYYGHRGQHGIVEIDLRPINNEIAKLERELAEMEAQGIGADYSSSAAHQSTEETVIPMTREIIEKTKDNPLYAEEQESLRQHLAEYDRLLANQLSEEAKAAEQRQNWEDAVNYDPENLVRTEFDNQLVESVRTDDNDVYNRYSRDGGDTWSSWQNSGTHSKEDDIVLAEVDGKLFQVIRNPNNNLYVRHTSNGKDWTGWSNIGAGAISGAFAVDAIGDQLVVSVRHSNNQLYTRGINSSSWQSWNHTAVPTLTDFQQEMVGDRLVQSYKGIDGESYIRHTTDGKKWTAWERPDTSLAQADWRLSNLPDADIDLDNVVSYEFQDRTVQLVRDSEDPSNRVYQRSSSDGGATWSDWTYAHIGSTADDLQILSTEDRLFQVARHPNNILYVRHSTDGEAWSSWIKTSNWGTTGDFAADIIDDELVIGVRYDGNNIVHTRAFDGSRWTAWESASQPTLQDIEQEVKDGRLIQTYRGLDDIAYTRHTNDGVEWSDWQAIDKVLATSEWERAHLEDVKTVAESFHPQNLVRTSFDNKLVEVSLSPENTIYNRYSTDEGQTWTEWKTNQGYKAQEETLRLLPVGDRLFQVHKNANNHIYFRHSEDGVNWTSWNNADVGTAVGDYQANVIGNALVISALHSHNDLIYSRTIVDGRETTRTNTSVKTLSDFQQEVIGDRLVQSYRGIDDLLYTRSSADGIGWTDWDEVPTSSDVQTNFNPKNLVRTSFDNKLVEVSLSPQNTIYNRYSTDGGQTWTTWKTNQGYGAQEGTLRFFHLGNKLFQVHKNGNNNVYFRYSQDGVKWTNWNNADVGITVGDYQADIIGNALVISALHNNNLIYSRTIVDGRETTRTNTSVKTLSDFQQEVIGDRLVQSYRGIDDLLYTRSSADGIGWTDWDEVPTSSDVQTNFNPKNLVRTSFDNKLVEVSLSPQNTIYNRYSTDGGQTWTTWKTNQGYGAQEGTLRFFHLGNKLFQVHKNGNNNVYFRYSQDGVKWTNWNNADVGITVGDYQADIIGNALVISALHNNNLIYSRTIVDGREQTRTNTSVKTLSDFQQEVMGDRLVQSYRGIDNIIYTRNSVDGLEWTPWKPIEEVQATSSWEQSNVPDVKADFDAIAQENLTTTSFDGKQIQTLRDDRGYVYRRYSTDEGNSWSDWQYAKMLTTEDKVRTVQVGDRLYQLWKHPNNTVYAQDSIDGVSWRDRGAVGGPSEGDYELDVVGEELVFAMRHASNNQIYTRTVNGRGMSSWDITAVPTINGVQQEVTDSTITQTYLGTDNNVYTRSSTDGKNWTQWQSHDIKAREWQTQKEAHLPAIVDNTDTLLRPVFLDNNPENGSAIEVLQAEIQQQRHLYESELERVKAQLAEDAAQASAAIVQADWYEQRAAYHWGRSRKNGPTWTEWRKTWKRGRSGKKEEHWVQLTHVDHDWILWDTYTKYAQQLRAQGVSQIQSSNEYERQEQRLEPIAEAWIDANDAANLAEPPIKAARNLVEVLKATGEQIPAASEQLQILEDLLPEVQQKLAEAQQEADEYNAKVLAEWEEYDSDAAEYMEAISDVIARRAQLNQQSQEAQHQLAEVERSVERQSVGLETELTQVIAVQSQLATQIEELKQRQATATGDELTALQTMRSQLEQSLPLLESKAAVLTAQQTALTQKRTLLTAQNEVIIAEQRLLDAYLVSPDEDTSTLQQQLASARAALAEAQRLAAQAEASSNILTAPLQALQANLLAQNDEHLQAAKAHQAIIKELLEATELNANYTLEAAQQQQAVNDLEFQILQRLQEATAAGSQEARHLLDVAKHNDIATAAEIWHRDYKDIASDKGGSCAGGIARAEDRWLADRYYSEMLRHRELQRRAQAQANHFGRIKETAQAQMAQLQDQQSLAQQLLDEANAKIAQTSGEVEAKQQELEVAQARLDGITRIRESTEQTFVQLVALEKLNLAQAQLEQQIAAQRQADIEQAVEDRIRREQLELERQRKETQAKLEQLQQLQVEAQLQETLNDARSQVGLETLDVTGDSVQRQTQMASLLTQLEGLEGEQYELPENLKVLLEEVKGDIHLALQGEEAASIQENLLQTTAGLIGQVQHYQTEISRLDLESQWDSQLLQLAQQDLRTASQQLLEELERTEVLSEERQIIEPLYIETLAKVAYAEQAVDISQDLAQQSREMLSQIIEQREVERKARKKYFWNQLLGMVSTILGLVSTVLLLFPPTTAFGAIAGKVGLGLALVSGGINAAQAAINGDWIGAIFSGVMAGSSFITGGLGNALKAAKSATQTVWGMTQAVAQKVLYSIKSFQSLASGAFSGVRNALSGDSIMGFLQMMSGLASAATSGIAGFVEGGLQGLSDIGQYGYKVLESLASVPTSIYGSIKAISDGDWVNGIGNILKSVASLAKTWTNDFNDGNDSLGEQLANAFEDISAVGVGVSKFITGGLDGVLDGLGDIIAGLGDDISKWLEEHLKQNCECIQKETNQESVKIKHLIPDDIPLSERENIIPIYINGINTYEKGQPGLSQKEFYDMTYEGNKVVINKQLEALGIQPVIIDTYNKSGINNNSWEKIPILGGLMSHVTDIFQSTIQGTTPLSTIEGIQFTNSVKSQIESLSRQHPNKKILLIGYSQGNFFTEDIVRNLPLEIQKKTKVLSIASFTDYSGTGSKGIFNIEEQNPQAPVKVEYLLRSGDFSDNFKLLGGIAVPNNQPNLPDIGSMMENHSLESYVNTDAFQQKILRLLLTTPNSSN